MELLDFFQNLDGAIKVSERLFESRPGEMDVHIVGKVVGASSAVNVPQLFDKFRFVGVFSRALDAVAHPRGVLRPKLFVERASDEAALKENFGGVVIVLLLLKFEVLGPVFQLKAFQRLDVKIRTLDGLLEFPPRLRLGLRLFEDFPPLVNDLLLQKKMRSILSFDLL